MTTPNKHIEDFLEYYYKLPNSPEYAVLLKSAWGSGKTWFIKKFLETLEDKDGKYIYVSLYGLKNTKSIEQEIMTHLLTRSSDIFKNNILEKAINTLKVTWVRKFLVLISLILFQKIKTIFLYLMI